MKVVLGFGRSDTWLLVDDNALEEEDLRKIDSNLAAEKVVETAIVGKSENPNPRLKEEEEEGKIMENGVMGIDPSSYFHFGYVMGFWSDCIVFDWLFEKRAFYPHSFTTSILSPLWTLLLTPSTLILLNLHTC